MSSSGNKNSKAIKEPGRSSMPSQAAAIPTNLPPENSQLVGRERELNSLLSLLSRDDIRLVTLTGLGGAGKTSLALHTAYQSMEMFPAGVFFIGLASLTNSKAIPTEIARILKIEQDTHKEIFESVIENLSSRKVLLILDNFEHLMEGVSYVADLLRSTQQLKIVVTSREPLRLRSEQEFPVPPLSSEYAVELFLKRAKSLNPDYSLAEDETKSVVELCKRLDGLPLAIELASLRTKLFTPKAMLARLTPDLKPVASLLDFLSTGARDLPKRQQSLRNMIAWSYSLLSAEEQEIFRAASIFPAGFNIQRLSILFPAKNENQILDLVSSLVDKNLIKPSLEKHSEPRFILLDTIREYAWDEILRLKELDELKGSYIDCYLAFTEELNKGAKGNWQSEWFDRAYDEFLNSNLAIEMCLSSQPGSERWKSGYRILDQMHLYWTLNGHSHTASEYITQARLSLEEYVNLNPGAAHSVMNLRADIYSLSGSGAWADGEFKQAISWHEAAYQLYEELNDEGGMATSLNHLGVNLSQLGDFESAVDKHKMGLVLNQKLGDRWAEMRQLFNLGSAYSTLGTFENAVQHLEPGLAIAREINDLFFISAFLLNYGYLYLGIDGHKQALAYFEQSLDLCVSTNNTYMQAWTQAGMALTYLELQQTQRALPCFTDSHEIANTISDAELNRILVFASIFIHTVFGDFNTAAILLGCLKKFEQTDKVRSTIYESKLFMELEGKVRTSILPDEFEILTGRGMTMSLKDGLLFAVDEIEKSSEKDENPHSALTIREQDVLRLLAQGMTNEQISKELVVVQKTVEKHVANILRKLGVKNRTEAAAWAAENQIK